MVSTSTSITGSLIPPVSAAVAQERWANPLSAFTQVFNGGEGIAAATYTDRFAGSIRWLKGGENREGLLQMSLRHAADRIAGGSPRQAEKAVYVFAKQLMHCGLVDVADEAMRFGALHFLGESTRRVLDLSDIVLREAVFERLISAGLAVRTDTSMLPSEWGLGESWVLIKRSLDHGQFDEESRRFVGVPLLQRKIDPTRPDVENGKRTFIAYRRTDSDIETYRRVWLERLQALEEKAEIPVAWPAHHVDANMSVRRWRVGARRWNLHFPQHGLSTSQVTAAHTEFNEVAEKVRDAGVWTNLSDSQIARNLVYQLSDVDKPQWVAIEA